MLSADPTIDRDAILAMLRDSRSVVPELQEIFAEEAEDHLRTIYDGLDRLQVDGGDRSALGDIRRASHTLKGAAGAVGVESVTRLSHRMEDLLDDLADNQRQASPEMTRLLLTTADQLEALTGDQWDAEAASDAIIDLYRRYASVLGDAVDTQKTSPHAANDLSDDPDLDAAESKASGPDVRPASPDRSVNQPAADSLPSERHIRVPLSRLDEINRLVSEMMISRGDFARRLSDFNKQIDNLQTVFARLRQVAQRVETHHRVEIHHRVEKPRQGEAAATSHADPLFRLAVLSDATTERDLNEFDNRECDPGTELHSLAQTLSEATTDVASMSGVCRLLAGDFDTLLGRWQRLTREAQDRLKQIRTVPLRTAIPRLERSVRSTASACGKQVRLVVRGDHTELDKTVLEAISDPLLHMLRNAVAHGIEMPQRREALGKRSEASLIIEAVKQGTQLTLRVEDDGAGLDTDRIRRFAIERGLIKAEQTLSETEIHRLIFAPGFSTADAVTDVSGRGVGLDIVRETVKRLGGSIRVDSARGLGTKLTIVLPTPSRAVGTSR